MSVALRDLLLRIVDGTSEPKKIEGGAVAEWSKALLVRENKRKTKKDPRFAPVLGNLKKAACTV